VATKPIRSEPTPDEIEQARDAALTPTEVIAQANDLARHAPVPEGFVGATLTYDYMPGALYEIQGAPNHLTTVSFAPGETIYSFAAGDTLRWLVEKTYSGEGANRRLHLLIQPTRRGLHTTMVVTSSRGVYHFELKSAQHEFVAGVEFRHPRVELVELHERLSEKTSDTSATSGARGAGGEALAVDLGEVVDAYQFVLSDRDDPPAWMPRRVFHDGKRTYIDFGKRLGDGELPGLFLLGRDRSTRLVQYRVSGRYMIVGEVVEFAVLRLGASGQGAAVTSVGIELKKEARR
jgi:type IV secretion system protein VirB9